MTARRIFTIGYEGATQPELIAALAKAGVRRVIDVRAVPLSRKPGFSKNVLAAGLKEAGIDYVHLKALGTPPEGREAARKGKWDVLARIYAAQLETPEAGADAARMVALAQEKPSALLCFERDPAARRCGSPLCRIGRRSTSTPDGASARQSTRRARAAISGAAASIRAASRPSRFTGTPGNK